MENKSGIYVQAPMQTDAPPSSLYSTFVVFIICKYLRAILLKLNIIVYSLHQFQWEYKQKEKYNRQENGIFLIHHRLANLKYISYSKVLWTRKPYPKIIYFRCVRPFLLALISMAWRRWIGYAFLFECECFLFNVIDCRWPNGKHFNHRQHNNIMTAINHCKWQSNTYVFKMFDKHKRLLFTFSKILCKKCDSLPNNRTNKCGE